MKRLFWAAHQVGWWLLLAVLVFAGHRVPPGASPWQVFSMTAFLSLLASVVAAGAFAVSWWLARPYWSPMRYVGAGLATAVASLLLSQLWVVSVEASLAVRLLRMLANFAIPSLLAPWVFRNRRALGKAPSA